MRQEPDSNVSFLPSLLLFAPLRPPPRKLSLRTQQLDEPKQKQMTMGEREERGRSGGEIKALVCHSTNLRRYKFICRSLNVSIYISVSNQRGTNIFYLELFIHGSALSLIRAIQRPAESKQKLKTKRARENAAITIISRVNDGSAEKSFQFEWKR